MEKTVAAAITATRTRGGQIVKPISIKSPQIKVRGNRVFANLVADGLQEEIEQDLMQGLELRTFGTSPRSRQDLLRRSRFIPRCSL